MCGDAQGEAADAIVDDTQRVEHKLAQCCADDAGSDDQRSRECGNAADLSAMPMAMGAVTDFGTSDSR